MLSFIHWNPDPEIFGIGPLSIRWYSLLFVTGIILSYQYLKHQFKAVNLKQEKLDVLTGYVVLGIIIGARLGHCLFYDFDYYSNHILEIFLPVRFDPSFEFTGFRGLASHGGGVGIITALWLFSRKEKVKMWWLLDMIAIVTPLAGASIRLGNLMNSEIVGMPTEASYGFIFMQLGETFARHPAQLYEALACIVMFVIVHQYYKRNKTKHQDGFVFGMLIAMLFVFRFSIEFVKEVQGSFENDLPIKMGQILSIPFVLVGIFVMFLRRKSN